MLLDRSHKKTQQQKSFDMIKDNALDKGCFNENINDIDSFMTNIKKYANNPHRVETIISMLNNDRLVRVYIRLSGHLHTMCCLLDTKEPTSNVYMTVLALISSSVKEERKSLLSIIKEGILDIAIQNLHSLEQEEESEDSLYKKVVVSCKLIAVAMSFIGEDGYDVEVVFNPTTSANECSRLVSLLLISLSKKHQNDPINTHLMHDGIILCTDILSKFPYNALMSQKIEKEGTQFGEDNPIRAIFTATTASMRRPENICEDNIRLHLLKTMGELTRLDIFRSCIVNGLCIDSEGTSGTFCSFVPFILSIINNGEQSGACREAALELLINASYTTPRDYASPMSSDQSKIIIEDSTIIRDSIIKHGGLDIFLRFFSIPTEDPKWTIFNDTSFLLLHRASILLAQCVKTSSGLHQLRSIGNCKSTIDPPELLVLAFTRLVLDSSRFNHSGMSSSDSIVRFEETISNIISILAIMNRSLNVHSAENKRLNFLRALVKALPEPKTDCHGQVSTASVCQIPEITWLGIDSSNKNLRNSSIISTIFQCSLTKLIISFINENYENQAFPSSYHAKLFPLFENLLERLICLLANSSKDVHPLATKNAASALAKLVIKKKESTHRNESFASSLMSRCRSLRGMEILRDLNLSGKL
mmetsp:Transcript_65574/g.77073  ORF Transcript_65574/g.77073 Transcript_65574/m.77073 type:complete len:646 (-) Transcript_65574:292-2229(-)